MNTKCWYLQFPEFLTELPSIRIDAGYGVVAEEKLLEGSQAVQGATVHLCKTVVVQMTAEGQNKCVTSWYF